MAYRFTSAPLTRDTWADLEALAERRGQGVQRRLLSAAVGVAGPGSPHPRGVPRRQGRAQ